MCYSHFINYSGSTLELHCNESGPFFLVYIKFHSVLFESALLEFDLGKLCFCLIKFDSKTQRNIFQDGINQHSSNDLKGMYVLSKIAFNTVYAHLVYMF